MIKNVINHEKIGSISIAEVVLARLQRGPTLMEDIRTHAVSRARGAYEAMEGCLFLLQELGYIDEEDGYYSAVRPFHSGDFLMDFINKLGEEGVLAEIFNQRTTFLEDDRIYVDTRIVPFKYSQIRNFFSNSKILIREENHAYRYYVDDEYVDLFVQKVAPVPGRRASAMTLEKLKQSQEEKEKRGEEAEKFVLEYERRVREKHPNCKNIRIISEEDVGAGYDIESYQSDASTELDKFIEVKSHLGTRSFYWTRNERETAQRLGSKYYLYIVDSKRLASGAEGYEPEIIENPYERLKDWEKTCESWRYDLGPQDPAEAE